MDRIIVERLHGHWSAWFDGQPQIAFGGASPAEAVDRLAGFIPEPTQSRTRSRNDGRRSS